MINSYFVFSSLENLRRIVRRSNVRKSANFYVIDSSSRTMKEDSSTKIFQPTKSPFSFFAVAYNNSLRINSNFFQNHNRNFVQNLLVYYTLLVFDTYLQLFIRYAVLPLPFDLQFPLYELKQL